VIVAYYHSDNISSCIDAFPCIDYGSAIVKLIDVMRELSGDRILDTASEYLYTGDYDGSLQCLDTWCEEFNHGKIFTFTIKARRVREGR
jgi:hypothetical protein